MCYAGDGQTVAALVAIYYLLPLDHTSQQVAITILIIGLAGFIALARQNDRLN